MCTYVHICEYACHRVYFLMGVHFSGDAVAASRGVYEVEGTATLCGMYMSLVCEGHRG